MGVGFDVATPSDEAEIRRLLRENAIGGGYAMSLEREPDGFSGVTWPGERKTIILARDRASGAAVGLAERIVRPAFVDGQRCLLPYLGALRIAASYRHRIDILKGGFAALEKHGARADELPYALTSITADNAPARRVLTAGIAGLPRYDKVADYTTLVLAPGRSAASHFVRPAADAELSEVADFLNAELERHQFAPVWTKAALRHVGAGRVLVYRHRSEIRGTVAVWDQSGFKQTVARGYPPAISLARPVINILSAVLGRPRLPQVGQPLSLASLSALAVRDNDWDVSSALLRAARGVAAEMGVAAVVAGMDTRHPWVGAMRNEWPAITYQTGLYRVGSTSRFDRLSPDAGRLTLPDVGLL